MINEVFFDVETKNLFNEIGSSDPGKLGVSVVAVYSRKIDDTYKETSGSIESFWENDFAKMWPIFQNAHRIIGFNTIRFDVPALTPYSPINLNRLPHLDIFAIIRQILGHSLSLNCLATTTLGKSKTDNGLAAVDYWKKGDRESLEKLRTYCEADVILTKDIYDHAIRHKELKFRDKWNSIRTIPVDFSYPKEIIDASRQMGMF